YSEFYGSDLIVASPLGLRLILASKDKKKKDNDFLSSIEILVLDRAHVFGMQNWDHIDLIMENINKLPTKSHDADISRIRSFYLDGLGSKVRQTLVFTEHLTPEINHLFSKSCSNYSGYAKVKVEYPGTMTNILRSCNHLFYKVPVESIASSADDRFNYFIFKILPVVKDALQNGHVCLFVPSYFDFVRIRNHLTSELYSFNSLSEYTSDKDISRTRTSFFKGEVPLLLVTERFVFFKRYRIRGIEQIFFYQLPDNGTFYSEIINFLEEKSQICALFSKYDVLKLNQVVGNKKATTDNHIGYLEKDPIRKNDSFETFEEILQLAHHHKVDLLLLGGDLFHDNKPSRNTLFRVLELFRKGEKECSFQLLSDQQMNFAAKCANHLDPNLNISMPAFIIHGNHDDPTGDSNLSALHLLSAAGSLNLFGGNDQIDDIQSNPILIQKGSTKLALYGIGNIRDERLHRTFQQGKVKFARPVESTDEWFNLLVFHQNRVQHGPTNYIPETFLPDFLDLVLWGHEHDSNPLPEKNELKEFFVIQPGSSTITSLSEGEALPKHVGLLSIKQRSFSWHPIPLKTVRPFIMDTVSLSSVDGLRPSDLKGIETFLKIKIDEMIQESYTVRRERLSDPKNPLLIPQNGNVLPLIRLKVDYSGDYTTFNPLRFGQNFVDKAANPRDLLVFFRKRQKGQSKKIVQDIQVEIPEQNEELKIEDLISDFLAVESLEMLPQNELGDAVRTFVDKEEKDSIHNYVEKIVKDMITKFNLKDTITLDFIKETVSREKAIKESIRVTSNDSLVSPSINTKEPQKQPAFSDESSNDADIPVSNANVESDDVILVSESESVKESISKINAKKTTAKSKPKPSQPKSTAPKRVSSKPTVKTSKKLKQNTLSFVPMTSRSQSDSESDDDNITYAKFTSRNK
ncbi:DNA repair exonuclease, partial [Rozella allomycis CSF55]